MEKINQELTVMTATRCLNELKLLHKRIQKKTMNSCFLTGKIKDEILNTDCDAAVSLQSITDLINRREVIKAALMASNAKTEVKIGSETMTVAMAIEKKSSIEYLRHLLSTLREQRLSVTRRLDKRNIEAQERLDKLLESTFGKDLKARPTEITDISDTFWKSNKMEFHDPIKIDEKIKELDEYIDTFTSEVDLVLSETNAKTDVSLA